MRETSSIIEQDLDNLAEKVVTALSSNKKNKAKVIFLEGNLGAGKTTFTKSLAQALGIDKEEVNSPTFILKKEYPIYTHNIFRKLIHIDAYRFIDKEEDKVLNLDEDIENSQSIVVIEWPSKMSKIDPDMTISFAVIDDVTRAVTISYEEER